MSGLFQDRFAKPLPEWLEDVKSFLNLDIDALEIVRTGNTVHVIASLPNGSVRVRATMVYADCGICDLLKMVALTNSP
jgi:hypothetical protein